MSCTSTLLLLSQTIVLVQDNKTISKEWIMLFRTRIVTFFLQKVDNIRGKWRYLEKNFALMLTVLLMGFVVGNIFGTILNVIRQLFNLNWDGLIIIIFLFVLEIISYTVYHSKDRAFLFFLINPLVLDSRCSTNTGKNNFSLIDFCAKAMLLQSHSRIRTERRASSGKALGANTIKKIDISFWQFANYFKIGLLIGFFIDAFKVGS